MATISQLTLPVAFLLWLLTSRIAFLVDAATNIGIALSTLTCGYWLLWYGRRAFFNELVDPSGKVVLIAGCHRGFGHTLAQHLASDGFFVFAGCSDENNDGADIKKMQNIMVLQMDITKQEEIDRAYRTVEDYLDGAGRVTMPEFTAYCIIKNALTSLAAGLRLQYFNSGLQACTVEPGSYRTDMVNHKRLEDLFDRDLGLLPERVRERVSKKCVANFRHTADVLLTIFMTEDFQKAVDFIAMAMREEIPRACYKPGPPLLNIIR